jgi:hypothetical protein
VIAEAVLRAAAALAVLLFGSRARHRPWAAALGALAAFAVLGPTRAAAPSPAEAAVLSGVLALLLAAATQRTFPSISEDGAVAAALMAAGAAAVSLVSARRLSFGAAAVLAVLSILTVSSAAAEACRAGGEAGWREGLARALGVAVPAALGGGLSAAVDAAGRGAPWILVSGLVAAVLVWAPTVLAESARVKAELDEEVRLGLLPPEDADALRFPWTRGLEKRFGRADERREYVRSALLLAAARHQQRHRTGEAVRLRQLEVLTFRTRLRRTQDARAARFDRGESGEFGRPGAPDDEGSPRA